MMVKRGKSGFYFILPRFSYFPILIFLVRALSSKKARKFLVFLLLMPLDHLKAWQRQLFSFQLLLLPLLSHLKQVQSSSQVSDSCLILFLKSRIPFNTGQWFAPFLLNLLPQSLLPGYKSERVNGEPRAHCVCHNSTRIFSLSTKSFVFVL